MNGMEEIPESISERAQSHRLLLPLLPPLLLVSSCLYREACRFEGTSTETFTVRITSFLLASIPSRIC